ncbi:WD repeat-containing protein 76, partial [Araneus ventricosus]
MSDEQDVCAGLCKQRNIQKSISENPNIQLSDVYDVDVYDVQHYERNMKRSISNKPNINSSDESDDSHSSDEYDDPHYEGKARIDDEKSCSKPEVHVSGELNSTDEQDNNMRFKKSAIKYKKYAANRNESTEECEMPSFDSSDEYEMPSPDSSDDWEMPSSDSSDEYEMLSPDSSDEWERSSSDASDELETHSNTSNDYYASSDSFVENEGEAKKKKKKKSKDKVKKMKNEKPDLSEYEKMVQKNRDEKMAFLQSLKMDEVKEDLNEAIRNLKPKRLPRKSNTKSPKSASTSEDPIRKSLRLAEVHIDFSEAALEARALAGVGKEIKKKLSPILTFEEAITKDNIYADFVCDYDDLDFKTPKPFTDYVSCFKNMKIDKSKIAKVVNGMITAIAVHPMKEKVIVSAGNKCGAIGFWHVTSDSVPYVFVPHTSTVSCIKFNGDSLNQIISCSHDGTMRCGDMEKRVFNEVFDVSEETSCNYFDFISPTTTIVCHRNGNVSLVDIRSSSKSAEKSLKCHQSPVKTVSVHPVNKNYFVSADLNGFLSIWDLRKFLKRLVIEVHPLETVITSAFFSPVNGNSILTTSPADDSLCLFNSSKLGGARLLYSQV